MNFATRIADAGARFLDRVAIERVGADGVQATPYAALLTHAGQWSGLLRRHGIGRGSRVALLGENDEPWIAAYLGILRLGAVAVPLDINYRPDQVATLLAHSGAALLLRSERFVGTTGTAGTIPVLAMDAPPDRTAAAELVDVAPDDPAVMLYTSGTTADPKGVVLTHANLEAERQAALGVIDCSEHDAILGVLPLFHSLAQMANLLVPLSVGARVVFLETVSSASLVSALQERRITIFACVPQFFYLIHQRVMGEVAHAGLLRRAVFRLLLRSNGWLRDRAGLNPGRRWFARVHRALGSHMRFLITGGSRFDPRIGRDLYDLGFTLLNGYGLTETSGAATVQRPGDRFNTSVGQPLPGVEVKIAAPDPAAPADVEEGEILIRGPIVMREYFGRPDATAEAIRDGWLHTGDLGYVDAAGRVHITGRRKEIIVLSSGKNIYPEEIEAEYQQSPFVKELCVMGLARPDEPAAERLHAVVVPDEQALRARGAVNVRELIRFELEGRSVNLPAHKRVLSFDLRMEPLPRTTTGKLRRHEIQKLASEAAARPAAAAARPMTDAEREWASQGDREATLRLIASTLKREAVPPEANLELDLGLDSMERVELLTALEHRAGAHVPAETRAAIFTVRHLVEAVERFRGSEVRRGRGSEDVTPWAALLEGDGGAGTEPIRALDRAAWIRAVLFFMVIRAVRLAASLVWRLRIRGIEHLPRSGPFVLSPNHQSYFDGFVAASALPFGVVRRLFFVGAAEYYQTRFMRWLARLVNIVPVDPDANLVDAMRVSAAGLRSGHVLMLFPEGERTIDGRIRPFRKGAAILAAHLGVPIVPVGLEGLFPIWPRERGLQWRALFGARVAVAFGPPLSVAPGAYVDGTTALQHAVQGLVDQLGDNGG